MKTIFKIIVMSAALVGGTALADAPSFVEIDNLSYGGTGCPQGSVSENISDDNLAFTLLFDEYVAEIGPGVPRREARKACQISLDLKFPQGWSFTIFEADYRGYASLDRKVTGEQKSSYYFQGQRGSVSLKSTFRGEIDEDYEVTDQLGLSAEVWSPCGANRALNIKTQVRLTSRDRRASGILTVDSVDGELAHVYGIKWKRCRR